MSRASLRPRGILPDCAIKGPAAIVAATDPARTGLESVRDHYAVWHSFRIMRRMEAQWRKARAFRLWHSQSLASRRQRLSQAKVRSTIQRLGRTVKPLAAETWTGSDRLTISTVIRLQARRRPAWNRGP